MRGRALVAGNQAHAVIGALSLLGHGAGEPAVYRVITAVYVLNAVWFSWLRSPTGTWTSVV